MKPETFQPSIQQNTVLQQSARCQSIPVQSTQNSFQSFPNQSTQSLLSKTVPSDPFYFKPKRAHFCVYNWPTNQDLLNYVSQRVNYPSMVSVEPTRQTTVRSKVS